ncbi:N-acetylglucosamine-1-phosphodiester alpha-N-acetylglucosaminidase-like [Cyclopterus lumpus]|uniref:N-acetylglucosamine-1-phosphodiester alpha-N-acetylglucosaminidase-like n=1 Tax=Cyclopterus lumpus TaxID=8103 RepID=UPI001485CAC4|nr:N-acetylglucosamine-1-phosphodiester alpha-N-acetylglucosaminidase-like [Cyclopterus lumpus]
MLSVVEPGGPGGCETSPRVTAVETALRAGCLYAQNAGFFNTTSDRCLGNVTAVSVLPAGEESAAQPGSVRPGRCSRCGDARRRAEETITSQSGPGCWSPGFWSRCCCSASCWSSCGRVAGGSSWAPWRPASLCGI